MTEGEEIDYKTLYEDLKTNTDSTIETLKSEIDTLKGTIGERDGKITELQTYICKNLSSPEDPYKGGSFEERYKKAIKEM